jgi:hypothetical protein
MLSNSRWSRSGGRESLNASQNASQSSAITNPKSILKRQTSEQAKGTNKLISIVGKALERLSLSTDERAAWDAIKNRVKEPESVASSPLELKQIQENLRELTATVTKLVSTKPSSWAQVAALQATNPLAKPLPRKAREVLVTCSQSDPEVRAKTAAEVVQSIRSRPGGDGLITGARKLPSGAFALTFKSAEAKKAWQEQGALEATFGATAKAKENTLDVIVFGFPKGAISGTIASERLGAITSQNPGIASCLRRVGVLKGPQAKSVEAVILGFSDPKAANEAIDQGVLWESSVLNAEPYTNSIRSRRCFKCQSYSNHSARFCRGPARCGWCAQAGHTVTECPNRQYQGAKACAPCGGIQGHCALDAHCPARIRDDERARAAYEARPARFEHIEHQRQALPQGPLPQPIFQGLPVRADNETDDESFTVVGSKRRRGRPTAVSTADTTGIPNIASFLQVPSTQFTSTPLQSSQPIGNRLQGSQPSSTPDSTDDEAMTDTITVDV